MTPGSDSTLDQDQTQQADDNNQQFQGIESYFASIERAFSHTSLQRLHHSRTGWEAGGNPPDDTDFFKRILDALDHAGGTVITGPGNGKSTLKAFLDHARPHAATRVFAAESLDHPEAPALLALGRRYFPGAVPR